MLMSVSSTNSNINYQNMTTTTHITSGLGLLTTVAQLPPKYKIRYLARAALLETPLDLTVKQDDCAFLQQPQQQRQSNSITNFENNELQLHKSDNITENISKYKNINQHPITPPPSPPKKRFRDDGYQSSDSEISSLKITKILEEQLSAEPIKAKSSINSGTITILSEEKTPTKPIKTTNSAPRTGKSNPNTNREKKTTKAIRKLKFDEDTSSPVSGTIIRPLEEITNSGEDIQSGDIDPEFNIVEVTDEAKQELAQIKNIIGSYTCKLCRIEFEDAFGLARHRCSCIVLLEYRCPECGKRFNCPANLASHRRWHKPKEEVLRKQQENCENDQQYPCIECGKNFKRQAYLRKHLTTHKHKEESTKRKTTTKQNNNHNGNKRKIQKINSNNSLIEEEEDDDDDDSFSPHQNINSNSSHQSSSSIIEDGSTSHSRQSISNSTLTNNSNINNYHNNQRNNNNNNNNNLTSLYSNSTTTSNKYDSEYSETHSDCSSPGRLQIIDEHNNLTEEENIAAAALAHLRNGTSVIQHTTATMVY